MIKEKMTDKDSSSQTLNQKILIVDDDLSALEIYKDFLMEYNYKVDVAHNGFEAGVKLMEFKPDLLILDLIMPELDGFEVCQMIKTTATTEHIKIIVMTGYDSDKTRDTLNQLGADLFLVKPVEPDILVNHIKKILG